MNGIKARQTRQIDYQKQGLLIFPRLARTGMSGAFGRTRTGNLFCRGARSYHGLQSGPKEVDILDDQIVYPVVNINETASQISCISTVGTAILAGTADGQGSSNANYSFTWYNSLDLTGPVIGSNSTITNLTDGNYSLNATNATTGCSASALFIVPDDSPFFTPELSTVGVPLTFCTGLDGDAQVRVIPNPSYPFPYNYSGRSVLLGKSNLANPPISAPFPNVPGCT